MLRIALGPIVFIAMKLLLLFVDNLVFSTASFSESDANQVFEIHEDFRLVGHIIESLFTDEFDCGLRCVRNKKCKSYNLYSDEFHGNKKCELNDQTDRSKPTDFRATKGCTYYGKERRGFHSHYPGRSCKDFLASGIPVKSGEYWIDPENSGSSFKVFCDMSTNGGGWLLVGNFEIDDSGAPSGWTIEPTYRGISNYSNKRMGISRTALHELRKHLPFTQLRFHCSKQHARTFHVITATNSTGEAVVQYFSGQTDVKPSSCGSFVRMEDDNSQLAKQCANWGYNKSTEEFRVGKWGGVPFFGLRSDEMMYDHAVFISFESHWIVGKAGGRWECDDFQPNQIAKDFWRIFVR